MNTINLWKSYGHNLCKEFVDDGRIMQDKWINKKWVSKYIDKPDLNVKYVNKFLGLLAFEVWYRIFVTKELKNDEKLTSN